MITKCKSDIVTCLRNKGIEPEVRMSSNFNPDRSDIYNAKFGIDYIKSSTSYYVHTSNKMNGSQKFNFFFHEKLRIFFNRYEIG